LHLLEKIGIAVRDTIYEAFHELTKTVDLEEMLEKGYSVQEFPLSPSGLDKLYVLSKDKVIKMGGTLIVYPGVQPKELEVSAHVMNPERTLIVLKHISRSAKVASPKADNPNTKGDK
jgi:hypothetical protein